MTIQIAVVFFVALLILVGLCALLIQRSQKNASMRLEELNRQWLDAQRTNPAFEFLQREVSSLRDQMAKSLSDSAKLVVDSQKTVGDRLDRAAAVVGQVQKSLGGLERATEQVFSVGKDIAQLQDILRAPKVRGAFGELFLGDLLAQILPPRHFTLQHAFKSGAIVDAVVKLGGRLVSVDSKFPLENFKRLIVTQDAQEKTQARRKFVMDVRRHIDAISSKYLLPDEGTFEFALMYIPAENVYYETIIKDDNISEDEPSIMTYAFSKRVVPVSPNSFYAYLHTITMGLRGLEIEENARLIMDQLSRLKNDFSRFREDFALLGKHLGNSRTKYEEVERRLGRFEDKLLSAGGKDAEQLSFDAPAAPILPLEKP
jgi:DNA recombination protein RmuC